MLAILLIEMKWTKANRTPDGAVQRQKYYKPVRLENNVDLSGEGVFYKQCSYYQQGDSVYSNIDADDKENKKLYVQGKGNAFTGSFCKLEDIDIPCVMIFEETTGCYRIKWFDYGHGMPRRRGGNEDLYNRESKLAGQPNILNETAFVLAEGQSGLLKYNYRYASYHGQWYKCYYVYVVNDKILTQDTFLREYDYEYDQLADLF